jgi:hypothetical protein
LIFACAAFLAWMGYLGYAALTKSRAPVVSHIQSAAAVAAVVAELSEGPSPKVAVVERLWGEVPEGAMEVVNLPHTRGFEGPGKYLLYLTFTPEGWVVVGPQHSPGDAFDPEKARPAIYAWDDDVRDQAARLKPKK